MLEALWSFQNKSCLFPRSVLTSQCACTYLYTCSKKLLVLTPFWRPTPRNSLCSSSWNSLSHLAPMPNSHTTTPASHGLKKNSFKKQYSCPCNATAALHEWPEGFYPFPPQLEHWNTQPCTPPGLPMGEGAAQSIAKQIGEPSLQLLQMQGQGKPKGPSEKPNIPWIPPLQGAGDKTPQLQKQSR